MSFEKIQICIYPNVIEFKWGTFFKISFYSFLKLIEGGALILYSGDTSLSVDPNSQYTQF